MCGTGEGVLCVPGLWKLRRIYLCDARYKRRKVGRQKRKEFEEGRGGWEAVVD